MDDNKCNVVIVTYNSASTIEACIRSVHAQSEFVGRLVVVDNGSTDATVAIIEGLESSLGFEAVVVATGNTGFAGGYKTGSQYLDNAQIPTLCLNPDVELAQDTLARLLEALRSDESIGVATVPLVGNDGVEDSASRRLLPNLGAAAAYAVVGKLLPSRLRYNSQPSVATAPADVLSTLTDGTLVTRLDATTGALMMVSAAFRPPLAPIFDTDYWMYGEDLQLCLDAHQAGLHVAMVEMSPSRHEKGVSSGWPRSRRSNRAFHDALYIYYSKNLSRGQLESMLVRAGVEVRHFVTLIVGELARSKQKKIAVHATATAETESRVGLVAAVMVAAILPLVLAPLRARLLGPSGRGEFAFFQSSLTVIGAMSGLGLRHAYYEKALSSEQRFVLSSRRISLTGWLLSLAAGLPLAVIAAASFSGPLAAAILVVSLGGPLFALTQIEVANAQLAGNQRRVSLFAGGPGLVEFVTSVILIIVREFSIVTAILASFVSELGRAAFTLWARALDRGPLATPAPLLTKQLLASAWKFAPATLVPLLASNVDTLIYGAIATSSNLGLYAVAKLATNLLVLAALSLEGWFLASASRHGLFRALFRALLIVAPLAVVGGLAGREAVPLIFGQPYLASSEAFPLTAAAGFLGSLYVWTTALCAVSGRQRMSMVSAAFVLGGMVVSCVVVAVQPHVNPVTMSLPLIFAYTLGVLITGWSLVKKREAA